MKVAVTGGTGTVGAATTRELLRRGEEVVVLSRNPEGVPEGAEHRRVDLASGDGLAAGLAGVEVVVDAANAQRGAKEVLVAGTERLGAAAAEAGVRHHVLISIVGCDRVPYAYYRVKVAQEQAVAAGSLPWSNLRATQFHDLLAMFFAGMGRARLRPTAPARVQPVDVGVVAARLADAAQGEPGGRLPDIAGPRVETLAELSAQWRGARGRRAIPLRLPLLGGFGRALKAGELCNEGATTPGPTFAEWLARD
jgi:uncharacterized protein YbjT (DUF2867 family)